MESTDSPTSPPAKRALVIVVRGLSPAMLGAYGNEWIHTPTIDRFAARGVVYDQHFASDLDAKNDAIDFGGIFDHPGLYARHFTTTSPSPRERHVLFALRRDVYEWMNTISPDQPALAVIQTDAILPPWQPPKQLLRYYFGRPGPDNDAPTPWTGPLPRHVPPEDNRTLERLQDTHAAVISAFDQGLARLLAGCRRRGFGQNALVAITSDLAFPVGEQGPVGDGARSIIESVAHLPLILRLPEQAHAGERIAALSQPNDLARLLRDFFAGSPLPVEPPPREHIIIRCGDERAVRTADRLLIVPAGGEPRLYLKPRDRWEAHDEAPEREDEVRALVARMLPDEVGT